MADADGPPASGPRQGVIARYFGGMRFPWIFALTAVVFVVDLVVPDVVPFADEILLGGTTALLAVLRRRRGSARAGDPVEPSDDRPPR